MARASTATIRRRSRLKTGLALATALVGGYGLLAYIVLPWAWTHYEHQNGLAGLPMVTRTSQDIPGDPLNVGLIGSQEDVVRAMHAAGWSPADPITLETSLKIAGSVLLDRPYRDAPVSPLFYQGRREDLAFEKEVGSSADRRHHVRFWKTLDSGSEGRPVWLGSVTFDRGSGLSRYTGQITHHIAPDIDSERDGLVADLVRSRMVTTSYTVTGVGPTLNGRNGEGDRYYTDGEIRVGVLVVGGRPAADPPTELPAPPIVSLKNAIWRRTEGGVPHTHTAASAPKSSASISPE
jgi:LssY C-terminus